jgi:hypothetical protein
MERELDRAGRDTNAAGGGARVAGARTSGPVADIRFLQRSAGNRAVVRLLQRNGEGKVNIVDPGKASPWFKATGRPWNEYDAWMADFQFIQRCMMEPALYRPALAALEDAVFREPRRATEARDDAAPLDRVLLAREQRYGINPGARGAPIYTRTLPGPVFSEMSQLSVVATDPGAGAAHGAYTHRIQWWVIMHHAKELKHSPAELVRKAIDPEVRPPDANWPQTSRVPGIDEPQPVPELRGALWDALFDRTVPQTYPDLFNTRELGISHPELFTREILAGNHRELDEVARIIRAQVGRNWGGGGAAGDAVTTEAALTAPTYARHREGVYFKA